MVMQVENDENVFDISFSFASSAICWQVIYNKDHLDLAPDIIVDESFDPEIKDLNSFKNWSNHDDSLYKMIKELHNLFLIHQQKLLTKYESLYSELQEFISNSKVACEVSLIKDESGNDVVMVLIPLKIDSTILPEYIKMENNINCGCLFLEYSSENLSVVKPSLKLLKSIESALSGVENLRIPSYVGATLLSYFENINELLTSSIKFVGLRFKKRKDLIVEMLSNWLGCVIEYDNRRFFDASFLISINDFYFVFKVILSEHYPLEQPILVMQSIYNIQSKNVHTFFLADLNFNPQMEENEILENIKKCMVDNIEAFKRSCFKK
ncbi:BRISC and BRCA1-A complex member 2 isoform X3 [Hydra vulgaris]|uniref:BRISC and BRCA1-A complex member 2 isoform X3 n=1 Tax=Hydra vulgaris TaxID=6087 RepID=UPI001F5FB563|nr:BRISC and BRCA1-A complex member 2-like isoform X2 [Hydra vulgaris]